MSKLGRLLNLLKNLSGNQRKPLEAITTISKGIDKGVIKKTDEVPKTEAVGQGEDSVPAPNPDEMPKTLEGYSYQELKLLFLDGEMSKSEQEWFRRKKGFLRFF